MMGQNVEEGTFEISRVGQEHVRLWCLVKGSPVLNILMRRDTAETLVRELCLALVRLPETGGK